MASRPNPAFTSCAVCSRYARRRADVVVPHLNQLARARGLNPIFVLARYITLVHHRHLTGGSIAIPGEIG